MISYVALLKTYQGVCLNKDQDGRVGYHKHNGWQEHPVAVKHHQEYFASPLPSHLPKEGPVSRQAGVWLYNWSWKFTKYMTLPSPKVAQFLHQFVPSKPVRLYRFEQINEPLGKMLVSYSYNKEMVQSVVENANRDAGKNVMRIREVVVKPENIFVDMTRVPWEKEKLSEMDEVIVVRDPSFWEWVKLKAEP